METQFFQQFSEQLISANLSPSCVKLTRLSSGGFNVDYSGICYVGKINLYKSPTKYAIIKPGNKRATKVFDFLEDANEFVDSHAEYEIQTRNTEPSIYMQYLKGLSTIKELNNTSLNECIDHIPDWIRYIKYCMRNWWKTIQVPWQYNTLTREAEERLHLLRACEGGWCRWLHILIYSHLW